MALYKRGRTWWITFTTPTGRRVRQSAKTTVRKHAQELHDQLKSEAWRTERLGETTPRTWDEAAERWLVETAHKADHQKDKAKLTWLAKYLSGTRLNNIDRETLDHIASRKTQEASPTTANRYLALIRAILRKAAREWEWLDQPPLVRLHPERTRRIRWLTQEQARELVAALPEHQAEVTRFALATGLRQANILGLRWDQVELPRRAAWIHPDQAKAGRAIAVPLNSSAIEVVLRQRGKHPQFVFTYRGNPIRQVNTKAWQNALKRTGIKDFRWHDLRHTWASWHAQAGTPLSVLQELGGWETVEMVRRYAHLAPEHLAEHAERLAKTQI